jgi:hypothetical protein
MADTKADTKKELEPEREVSEPGGRKKYQIEKMSNEALAAAYGDGVRFRSHGPVGMLDEYLGSWLRDARDELRKRGKLELVKECLPVYFDPSRNPPVFGPGAEMVSQTAIERAIAPRALKSAG